MPDWAWPIRNEALQLTRFRKVFLQARRPPDPRARACGTIGVRARAGASAEAGGWPVACGGGACVEPDGTDAQRDPRRAARRRRRRCDREELARTTRALGGGPRAALHAVPRLDVDRGDCARAAIAPRACFLPTAFLPSVAAAQPSALAQAGDADVATAAALKAIAKRTPQVRMSPRCRHDGCAETPQCAAVPP